MSSHTTKWSVGGGKVAVVGCAGINEVGMTEVHVMVITRTSRELRIAATPNLSSGCGIGAAQEDVAGAPHAGNDKSMPADGSLTLVDQNLGAVAQAVHVAVPISSTVLRALEVTVDDGYATRVVDNDPIA